jgi:NADH-quinone oxidoreductase subunit C
MKEALQKVVQAVQNKFGDTVTGVSEYAGDVIILVKAESILDVLTFLKEDQHFMYLADMIAADRFTSTERFEMIYNLVSLRDQLRIFVKTRCSEENPTLPTATTIWRGANWHEREAYDMFGIKFEGHPDPRRIFMPEDFEYFPLRKEFPLIGIPGSLDLPSTNPDAE